MGVINEPALCDFIYQSSPLVTSYPPFFLWSPSKCSDKGDTDDWLKVLCHWYAMSSLAWHFSWAQLKHLGGCWLNRMDLVEFVLTSTLQFSAWCYLVLDDTLLISCHRKIVLYVEEFDVFQRNFLPSPSPDDWQLFQCVFIFVENDTVWERVAACLICFHVV